METNTNTQPADQDLSQYRVELIARSIQEALDHLKEFERLHQENMVTLRKALTEVRRMQWLGRHR